jgi:hypothetical protein
MVLINNQVILKISFGRNECVKMNYEFTNNADYRI